jgi:ATP-dependent DNA ligase
MPDRRRAIVCEESELAVFDLIRRHGALASAVHCAFDLLELDGRDLRRDQVWLRRRGVFPAHGPVGICGQEAPILQAITE